MVESEILRGKETDDLKMWMEGLEVSSIDHRRPEILEKYAAIVQYLSDSSLYKLSALTEWSGESVADPWLIVKIPDVATAFGVRTQPLYYLMRLLGFKLS